MQVNAPLCRMQRSGHHSTVGRKKTVKRFLPGPASSLLTYSVPAGRQAVGSTKAIALMCGAAHPHMQTHATLGASEKREMR